MRKRFILFFFFIVSLELSAQTDSCSLRISLLTCSPGEELYSTFGHSAMRVQDAASGTDVIFNYGTFEFGPDFYTKFIKGKLLYYLSTENFNDFVSLYAWDKRGIQEQVLSLNCSQKKNLVQALYNNTLEANKFYRYDFLYDNCSTRLRDIASKNNADTIILSKVIPDEAPTFRNLIHGYLNAGNQHWSKLGIDLLLGSGLDKKVTNEQAMFLPDYLMKGFDRASINGKPLTQPAQTVLPVTVSNQKAVSVHPMLAFGILLLIITLLSFSRNGTAQKMIKVFDVTFFLLLGLIGILLVFMWTGTDHALCRNNFNLLWALPSHAIAAFFLGKKNKWQHYYLLITIALQAFLLIGWIFLPQELNISLVPIVLIVLLRSWLIILQPHSAPNE